MSEEEKEAIELLSKKNTEYYYRYVDVRQAVHVILNLIENQQKELDNLKEIEKSHKEENGKLRIELEQYKLLEANIDKANKIIAENKFDEGLYGLLMQEKEKNKELNESLETSSGRFTQLTVENSELKYQLYHKQQIIDELTQNEENLKIELGKEKEKNMQLNEKNITYKNSIPNQSNFYDFSNYISKDKIKEKLEENIKEADDVLVNHNYLGNFNGNNKEQEQYYNGFKDASLFIGDLL